MANFVKAKHATHKSTVTGRASTLSRRSQRAAKRFAPTFDPVALGKELHAANRRMEAVPGYVVKEARR